MIMDITLLNENSATGFFKPRLPRPAEPSTGALFTDSGFVAMRDSWDENALYLSFDVTPLPWGQHAFFSKLCFYAWAYGKPLALNPGYGHGSGLGPTDLHNTVTVDGQRQEYGDARVLYWFDSPIASFVGADCDAYDSICGVHQQRHILFIKGLGWIVSDVQHPLWPGEGHAYQWHLHTPMAVSWDPSGCAVSGGSPGFTLLPAYPDEIQFRQTENDCAVPYTFEDALTGDPRSEKVWSGVEKVNWLTLEKSGSHRNGSDAATFLVALLPHRQEPFEATWQPLAVSEGGRPLPRGSAEAALLTHPLGHDVVVLSHGDRSEICCADVTTDARAGLVRFGTNQVSALAIVEATSLTWKNRALLEAQWPIAASVEYEDEGVLIHARTQRKTRLRIRTTTPAGGAVLNGHAFPLTARGEFVEIELPGPGSWDVCVT